MHMIVLEGDKVSSPIENMALSQEIVCSFHD